MPGPKAPTVVLAREDRDKLMRMHRAAKTQQRIALRAKIVLRAAEGAANEQIARTLGVRRNTVRKWRERFRDGGLDMLGDRPRSGRPPRFDGVVRCHVIQLACRPVPEAYCRNEWTLLSLRDALVEAQLAEAISQSTIGRILRNADLKPHKYRMWVHSPDPGFARKVREVIELYVRRPQADEVVVCVDEKTGMQALRRRFHSRLPAPGQPGRWELEYKRHGTRTLIAAFNIHSGHVFGQCFVRRRAVELVSFMEALAEYDPDRGVHVVWDNLNIHHGARWDEFNARHGGRFVFHHTPIHASWVNQVEFWFGILQRRVLRRASFHDASDRVSRVEAFIEYWNRYEKKPFRWTFTGYPVQVERKAAA